MKSRILPLSIIIGAAVVAGFVLLQKETPPIRFAAEKEVPLAQIEKIDESSLESIVETSISDGAAQLIVNELRKANPSGPEPLASDPTQSTLRATDPKIIAQKILTEEASKATASILGTIVTDDEIIIDNSASPAAYLKAREAIIIEATEALSPFRADSLSEAAISALASQTGIALRAMEKLPVPKKLVAIHKQQLRALRIQYEIFRSISDYRQDPVAATASVALIPEIEKEEALLARLITDYGKQP